MTYLLIREVRICEYLSYFTELMYSALVLCSVQETAFTASVIAAQV